MALVYSIMCVPNTSWRGVSFSLHRKTVTKNPLFLLLSSGVSLWIGLLKQLCVLLSPFLPETGLLWFRCSRVAVLSLCIKAPVHDLDYLLVLWERNGPFLPSLVD